MMMVKLRRWRERKERGIVKQALVVLLLQRCSFTASVSDLEDFNLQLAIKNPLEIALNGITVSFDILL